MTEEEDKPAQDMARASRRERRPWLISEGEVLAIAIFFLAAVTSLALTRNTSGSSLLWPANAITAALLVRWPVLRWGRTLFGLFVVATMANVLGAHDALAGSAAFAAVDVLEIAATAYLFRDSRVRLPFPNITFSAGVRMFLLLGVVIPALVSLAGGFAAELTFGIPFADATANWYTAIAAGAILCAPPIYLYSSRAWQRLVAPETRVLNLALALVCIVLTYGSIRYSRFPLITLSIPLIVVAFRVGAFGAALMCELVGAMVVILWTFGVRTPGPAVPVTAGGGALAGMPFLALAAVMISPIMMGFAADDRESALRAVRSNEERFRLSLRHSPISIVIRGLDGYINMVNDAFISTFGYTSEELRTLTAEQLVHPDDQQDTSRDLQSLLDRKVESYTAERRYRHRDGSYIWVSTAVSLVDGDDGAPMHFIAHVESLEARRQAERALAEERERLRTTLRAIGEAVITTDAVGQVTYLNAAAERLIGQRLEEIAGRRLDEVVVLTNPQTMRATSSMFALCVARGEPVRRSEYCLLHRPDGTPCYVVDVASPVSGPDSALSGVVVVLQDATVDVARERELSHRAAHDSLTGLINRFEFDRRLSECYERFRHIERPATLLVIDLDRFKAVNDTGGHAAGDEVLRRVAQTLTSVVRDTDIVARLGGDEFAILLPQSEPSRAELVGEKVLRAVSDLSVEWNGASHSVGASIGVAAIVPGMGNVKAWVAAADSACYEAKRAGRGQMRIAA